MNQLRLRQIYNQLREERDRAEQSEDGHMYHIIMSDAVEEAIFTLLELLIAESNH